MLLNSLLSVVLITKYTAENSAVRKAASFTAWESRSLLMNHAFLPSLKNRHLRIFLFFVTLHFTCFMSSFPPVK